MISKIRNVLSNKVIDNIKDEFGRIVYEAWKKVSGMPPLILTKSKGDNLIDYKIYGNSIQDGTPTPETPIEVESVGDRTLNLAKTTVETIIKNGLTITANADGTVTLNGTTTTSTDFNIGVVKNPQNLVGKSICIPSYSNKGRYFVHVYTESERTYNWLRSEKANQLTNVVPEGTTSMLFGFASPANTVYENFVLYPQINKGTTPVEYEPYGYRIPVKASNDTEEITTNIYLNEPLRKIKDYADYIDFKNKKIVRVIKKAIFDGTEYWSKSTSVDNRFTLSLAKPYTTAVTPPCVLCDRLIHNGKREVGTIDRSYSGEKPTGVQLVFGMEFETLDEFKQYIADQYNAGTPMYVNYVLYEEETETIELPNIPTLKGTSIIEVDTDIQPSNMEVIYKGKE